MQGWCEVKNLDKEVAVVTIDGRAYYTITNLLKRLNIPYIDIPPNGRIHQRIKLVLTTRKEAPLIQHRKVLCVENLGSDLNTAKREIFSALYGEENGSLIVGIDPGERIGFVVYYQQREVDGGVVLNVNELVDRVTMLMRSYAAVEKKVKIGDGDPILANKIAKRLYESLKNSVVIELVDERGTTSSSRASKRGVRDQKSASLIAIRQGRRYNPL
ncbi:MAG: hypothetical protein NZ896_00285 [Nitrososphaerales archaeon]|nr:hypothetical protein [Nitrososphaerales archaeon]